MAAIKLTPKVVRMVEMELCRLKRKTTQAERNRLNLGTLESEKPRACIYGQLTGNCANKRAKYLLNTCAEPYSAAIDIYEKPECVDFSGRCESVFAFSVSDFSTLECLIVRNPRFAKKAINFLKSNETTFSIK